MTSGTRSMREPHCAQGKPTSSTYGRWWSVSAVPESSSSSP
jgi:hypothetical protein